MSVVQAFSANLSSLARYGAFPDKDTFFISSGTWPADQNTTAQVKPDHLTYMS
jgi:hypothetical protein